MHNILTFDLEDWFHGNFLFDEDEKSYSESRVLEPTMRLLELLKETGNQATFFVLGSIAEKYPQLIEKIADNGHEIASHGFLHRLVYKLSPKEFEDDLQRSISVLERLAGMKILGYRAPYWSIYSDMKWVFEILFSAGLKYDSSVYPFKTYLYGSNQAPRFQYSVDLKEENMITEIPPSVLEFLKRRIPFCGGFYFRLLPYRFVRRGIKKINQKEKKPAVFYLHPYEIDANKTKNSKGLKNNFILHVNVKRAEKKLTRLLNDFSFISMRDYLKSSE
ncbi:MAG: DUF3473 domain-containing protein [Calditrichaeota bacterium]|nr:DUF3473 domain-containing protein [Calditrichota bacterium]